MDEYRQSSSLPSSSSSSSAPPQSELTTMTTPEQTSPGHDPALTQNDGDIWAESPPRATLHTAATSSNSRLHQEEVLSDLPSVRRQRMADGYRDGLSQSKAQVIQSGFDEGYPIGVAIALRIGIILGVIDGVLAGLKRNEGKRELREQVERILAEAKRDLGREGLLQGIEEGEVMRDGGVMQRVDPVIARWESRVMGGWLEESLELEGGKGLKEFKGDDR